VSVPGAVYVLNCQSNKALERTSPLGLLAAWTSATREVSWVCY